MKGKNTITFITNLSEENCIKNITGNAIKSSFSARFSFSTDFTKAVFYKIRGNEIRLERVPYSRNPYDSIFIGNFTKNKNGVTLSGNFHNREYLIALIYIWFIFAALFCGLFLFVGVDHVFFSGKLLPVTIYGDPLFFIIFPFVFIGMGISVIQVCKKFGKIREEQIVEFIEKTLEAKIEKN